MPRSSPCVLVVDDQIEMARLLADDLGEAGYTVTLKTRGADAVAALRTGTFDVLLTDLRMEQVDGFDVLAAARQADPALPVIVMTAFGSIDTAIEAIKRGAFHYLTKPFRLEEVRLFVSRALEERAMRAQVRSLRRATADRFSLGQMIGRSPVMKSLFERIERVAATSAPVLIRGESGTGKELVARAIHLEGARKEGPFVPVNCTALPAALLESELYGHLKGSFTGAGSTRRGLFVEADGGTLFLDEIGDMAPELQSKLLRVLEDGEIRAVGADAPRRVDVRIVAATHQDLERAVQEGRFRADLFYRLNVVPLSVPPLRQRREDLPVLVAHFLSALKARSPATRLDGFAPEAMARLVQFSWPGNVRELENFVERCGILSTEPLGTLTLVEEALPRALAAHPLAVAQREIVPLRELEDEYIAWVINECGGNKKRAAELLGIDASTIHRREKDRDRRG
ncbi:MAG: sigma-54 dependent transcriptional regulator [Myxococcota bacterium]|nr:sigma-54 dependent transcriptional regulator [Myxococcota bacterium]